MKTKLVATILALALVLIVGCTSLRNGVTPASIPIRSSDYAEVPGDQIAQNPLGIETLRDANLTKQEIIIMHRTNQIDLKRLAEDDTYAYQDALSYIDSAIRDSQQLQAALIGTESSPGLLMTLFPAAMALYAGRTFMKRPGDYDKDEVKHKITVAVDEIEHGARV